MLPWQSDNVDTPSYKTTRQNTALFQFHFMFRVFFSCLNVFRPILQLYHVGHCSGHLKHPWCFSPRLGGALRSHQHSRPDLNEEAPVAAVPQAPLWDPQSWGATSDKSPMKGSESPLTVVAEDPGSPNYRSSPGRARSPAPMSPEKGKSAPDPEAQMLRKPQLYSCYDL